jgi:hypothetical protein
MAEKKSSQFGDVYPYLVPTFAIHVHSPFLPPFSSILVLLSLLSVLFYSSAMGGGGDH